MNSAKNHSAAVGSARGPGGAGSARLDTDLNAHKIDIQELVEVHFERDFCLAYEEGDEDMLITVKDAYDYVLDPAEFRRLHAGQSRYHLRYR